MGIDQPPAVDPPVVELALAEPRPAVLPPPVVLAPWSLTDVATSVPPEFFTPWTTIASPGCSELLGTPRLFVSLVLEESVTLTVLPLESVR